MLIMHSFLNNFNLVFLACSYLDIRATLRSPLSY